MDTYRCNTVVALFIENNTRNGFSVTGRNNRNCFILRKTFAGKLKRKKLNPISFATLKLQLSANLTDTI